VYQERAGTSFRQGPWLAGKLLPLRRLGSPEAALKRPDQPEAALKRPDQPEAALKRPGKSATGGKGSSC